MNERMTRKNNFSSTDEHGCKAEFQAADTNNFRLWAVTTHLFNLVIKINPLEILTAGVFIHEGKWSISFEL